MVFSNQASKPMEEVAAAMGDAPRWFQLYWSSSDELVASFVRRAEACGCEAIVVTLDTTMLGWRPRDLDLAYLPFALGKGIAQYTSDPVFTAMLGLSRSSARDRRRPRAVRSLLQVTAAYPGKLSTNLRSACRVAAVRKFHADLLAPVADLGRPPVAPGADDAADPAQGHPPPGRRPERGRGRRRRDRRVEPRRPPGRRRDREPRRAARGRGGGRRADPGPARQRRPGRSGRLQGARARGARPS